jgi:putative hydrolase of the HAD superfamily
LFDKRSGMMEEDGIKAVVFDFGKVISFPPEAAVREEIAALAEMDVQTLDSLEESCRREYDLGTISSTEYYKVLLAKAGKEVNDELAEKMGRLDMQSWTRINPDTVKLMEDIKAAGLTVGILSNMPSEFLAMAREQIPVFKVPDVSVFSCEVGSVKPEDAIYESLLSALNLPPNDVVFIDDLPVNVEKARILGINAFSWKGADSARTVLKKLEIPI